MAVSRRGRWIAAGAGVALAAAVTTGVLAVGGGGRVLERITGGIIGGGGSGRDEQPPPPCPLTGLLPEGGVPDRPALAVKVENLPEARPQAGLQDADIVYEELVEGGITRFIAVYQCRGSERVGPVRSGRLVDPDVLAQFGSPLFGYAGGVPQVMQAVEEAGVGDLNYSVAADAYDRDPNRAAPHDLFTSTEALYAAAGDPSGPPEPVFTYSAEKPRRVERVATVHLAFSESADVYWRWKGSKGRWLRFHGTEPHLLEGGVQVSAVNVVVQVVEVRPGTIVDANGVPSPEIDVVGSGKAYVFRNGRMVVGTWRRESLSDLTRFFGPRGREIALMPGTTWVELLPSDVTVEVS